MCVHRVSRPCESITDWMAVTDDDMQECYCGNSLVNGASQAFITWSKCSTHCAGSGTPFLHYLGWCSVLR